MSKKGLSAIIGYVLLISITLALSVMVYGWLRFYVSEEEIEACSDNVNIIIRDYECYASKIGAETSGNLTVTLKNKGLFSVDGYVLRINNREGADFGLYSFNDTGSPLKPGEEVSSTYIFENYIGNSEDDFFRDITEFHKVTIVEVQPFLKDEEGEIVCQSYTSQKISCQ